MGRRSGRERKLAALAEDRARHGYEPFRQGPELRLGNCPFHAVAEAHRELVCGMNLSLMEGIVGGMDATDLQARRHVAPGQFGVAIGPPASGRARARAS
jgi:predicted ArsR family transcriptional regulator